MLISVATVQGDIVSFQVEGASLIATIKTLIQAEMKIPIAQQTLYFKSVALADTKKLSECGVADGDVLEVRTPGALTPTPPPPRPTSTRPSLNSIPNSLWNNPSGLQTYIRSQPQLLQELMKVNPTMAEAVLAESPEWLASIISNLDHQHKQRELAEQQRIGQLNWDPLDPAAQEKIAEEIRLKNVEENYEHAVEHNPESFGRVVMLYVPMTVNDVPLTAFVDSGAQSTIMSVACATRCGIMRLVDKRFAGIAKGVGTSKIIGRVHGVKVKFGKTVFLSSFTILENQDMDFLFGLDQLRKHQATIDLKDNVLRLQGEAIPFLAEKDLPTHLRAEERGSDSGSSGSAPAKAPTPVPAKTSSSPAPSASPARAPTSTPAPVASNNTARPSPSPSPPPASSPPVVRTPPPSIPPVPASPPVAAPTGTTTAVRSSPAPTAPAKQATSSSAGGANIREADITTLINMGYARQQAIQTLQMFGGNVELAASFLFEKSGGFSF